MASMPCLAEPGGRGVSIASLARLITRLTEKGWSVESIARLTANVPIVVMNKALDHAVKRAWRQA